MSDIPLLMIPQLLGAQHPIQYTNWQPNLPQSSMPKVPQMGHAAQMPALPNMPAQRAPAQAQQDPTSAFGGMGGGAGAMQGLMNGTGFNPMYYANKLFGIGQSSPQYNPTPNLSLSNLSLPNLAGFGF